MLVLFFTQILPFPPDAGPRIKTWNVLRYLADQGHQIILATFLRQEEAAYIPEVEKICQAVHVVPIRRSKMADAFYFARSNLSGRPFLVERDDLKSMRDLMRNLLQQNAFDVIHADQLTMAQFALMAEKEIGNHKPHLVFDAHNATWTIVQRMKQTAKWYARPLIGLEQLRIKKYEGMLLERFDTICAVTENDRQALLESVEPHSREKLSRKTLVIPIATDCDKIRLAEPGGAENNILTLGTLKYPPNADGIRWFMNVVFPIVEKSIPDAGLTIVGKEPPRDFVQAAENSANKISVTGYVTDLEPYYQNAMVMVVPVRAGGGMRVRILEALARGIPLVTTTVGLEGINAVPGRDVLVEDEPNGFARAVIRIMQDQPLRQKLSMHGRRLIEQEYNWKVVLKQLNQIYQ